MQKILLIEDEEPFASNLQEELKEYGLVTIKVDGGEEALELLENDSFQGVVLDLKLKSSSNIHGISVIEWLRKFQPNIPIIVITGHSHLAIRAFEYGVDSLMIKPVEGKYVSQYLKRAIEFRELKRMLEYKDEELKKILDHKQEELNGLKTYNEKLSKENKKLKSKAIYTVIIVSLLVMGFISLSYFFPSSILSPILLFIVAVILLMGGGRISKVFVKILGQQMQIESENKQESSSKEIDKNQDIELK